MVDVITDRTAALAALRGRMTGILGVGLLALVLGRGLVHDFRPPPLAQTDPGTHPHLPLLLPRVMLAALSPFPPDWRMMKSNNSLSVLAP